MDLKKMYLGNDRKNAAGENAARKNAAQDNAVREKRDKTGRRAPESSYLIAREDIESERQKELLYQALGPVFFGRKQAGSEAELEQLFSRKYGIDVHNDFYEGDEHYEEYREASQAIAEGMSIYGGEIEFEDDALANLADRIWRDMERENCGRFRRINTMLEE